METAVEALRKRLDLKPEEFARALGVSSGYSADLRKGRREPSLPVAAKLDQLAGEPKFLPNAFARKMKPGRAA